MYTRKLRGLLFILLMAIGPQLHAQYYNLAFRNLASINGLSQSEVICVFEDNQGFLWVGTGYGLTRYDGLEFRNYVFRSGDSTSIGGHFITDIGQDSKGHIWVGVWNSGISRLNPFTGKFENLSPKRNNNSIISGKVSAILVDARDRVWAATSEGLSVLDPVARKFQNRYREPGTGKPLSLNCVVKDLNDLVWIGGSGIIMAGKNPDNLVRIKTNIPVGEVNSFQFDGSNNGWMATDKGLFSFRQAGPDSIVMVRPSFFPDVVNVDDVEFDGNGNLWIGTRTRGLAIYFPKTGFFDRLREDYSSSRGLLSNRITDLYFDQSGGMWVSGENGLQSFHDEAQKFNIYPGLSYISDQVRGSTIYGLAVEDNLILLATSGGVIAYNRTTSSYLPVEHRHETFSETIRFRSIQKQGPDTWWVCSDKGLFEIKRNKGGFVLQRPTSIKDADILYRSLRNYLRDGNIYWFGFTHDGLVRYDAGTGRKDWYRHDDNNTLSLPNEVVNKISFDRDGNVMVGTDDGMCVLYKGARDFEAHTFGKGPGSNLTNRYVYDMYDDGKRIWIGTFGGGVNILDKRTRAVKAITKADGLCDNAIYTMVPEGDSILWLGTNRGLARLDMRTMAVSNFEKNDGMPSEEFNMLSGCRNANGEIFMGTVAGLISFDPAKLTRNLLLPAVYLARVRKNGIYLDDSTTAAINRDCSIVTRYSEDVFLQFSPMTYYGENETELEYRIQGSDEKWLAGEAGGLLPLVRFEPGTYTIDIRIKNYPGSMPSEIWTLTFTVLPPFWSTLGFRITAGLLALLIMYAMVRAYINRRLERQRAEFRKQQAVEQERARISAELHDDIGGGLTAIRLLSEMSLEHDHNPQTNRYLEKISRSSNDLIQKMNEIVWALNINNDSLQSLIAYTRQYAVSYLDDLEIRCRFITPENIPDIPVNGKNRRSIFLLVKESLNNVAKHADASEVSIDVRIAKSLHITIVDNGVGIEPESVGKGNGLVNMRRRVQNLKGEMEILNGKGTTVVFDIPVKSLTS